MGAVRRRGELRALIALAVALASMVAPAAAAANAYTRVSRYYFLHGSVPVCRFSSSTLQTALNEVSAFGEQYFADLTDAIQATLQAQAEVRCEHGRIASAPPRPAGRPSPPPRGLSAPASPTAATAAGPPAALLALGALGTLALLTAAAVTFGRWRGWSPEWIERSEHAWAEAGFALSLAGARWRDLIQARRAPSARRRRPVPGPLASRPPAGDRAGRRPPAAQSD